MATKDEKKEVKQTAAALRKAETARKEKAKEAKAKEKEAKAKLKAEKTAAPVDNEPEPEIDQDQVDWTKMAEAFESTVHALGDVTDTWTPLMHKHVETNTRYAEKCRAQIK